LSQENQEILRGMVVAVVFQNAENGYTVLRLRSEAGETITVVGTVPLVTVGERLVITGRWVNHATFGEQFQAEFLERQMPETEQEILAYLSGRTVKGIGKRTAEKIVKVFGADTLRVMEENPESLTQIPGITLSKALAIGESFRKQIGVRRLIEFLNGHHLPVELAMRLYRAYGDFAVEMLRDDPYLLADAPFYTAFAAVDAFAVELGVAVDDPRRVEAGVLFELRHNLNNGHTFLPADKLLQATMQLLDLDSETVEFAMGSLDETHRIVISEVAKLRACYLPELYDAETDVASRILQLHNTPCEAVPDLDAKIASIEHKLGIHYAPQQADAIRAAASSRLMVLTGGPGTGKTTTVNGILTMFDAMQLKTALAAPTGRAAKRLSELTGRDAATIHRLLEAQFSPESGEMVFAHDESAPLKLDALIVDECSMVDLPLMQSLLAALPEDSRLILVGDPDQLPSVGPGNVFSDIIRSGAATVVRLTEIFRQAQESLIVMNAHAINDGDLPILNAKNRDFFFLKRRSGESVVQTICDLCSTRLPKNMGIPATDIQVLSPNRRYETGTKNLNAALQATLNPPSPDKPEKKHGDFLFRLGDRVMQIRNNYDILWKKPETLEHGTGIFNGDIGVVTELDLEEETMTVRFDDRVAVYTFDMLGELELAYAMTVHKAQGSEYRAVILSVYQGSPFLLTRGVLYTGVTRARELLILVGNEEIVAQMTANDRQQKRYSGLKLRIAGDLT
jgi:exodeoxyribonuclease V alpha subunit